MFFNSHDSSTAADIEIEGGSTQNSWMTSSKIHSIGSMCTSKDPWVDSYLHNYNGEVLLQWKIDPSKSYECPWNTKLVCLWSFPSSSYQLEWQTTLRCYWSTARSNTKKIHLQRLFHLYSGWFLCPFLGVPLYKSTSSSHPWRCNKVVFSVEQKSVETQESSLCAELAGVRGVTGSCPPPGLRSQSQCRPSCQCPQWSHPLSWWR